MSNRKVFLAFIGALTLNACSFGQSVPPNDHPPSFDDAFWRHWGDGQAELAGYDLRRMRYKEERRGHAVAIFVTEEFSDRLRVKADPGNHPADDTFPVMKLNHIERFQTGVYDYHLMTSAFVALADGHGRGRGTPSKISFSSQEWCGQMYGQMLFDNAGIRLSSHSYFDGEADSNTLLDFPQNGLSEDVLLLWARGLAAPVVKAGETLKAPFLPGLATTRLNHTPPIWQTVELSHRDKGERITVPAGEFSVVTLEARADDGRTWRYDVEKAWPHRIIRWLTGDGEVAELRGVRRMKYWERTHEGDEALLRDIGLTPPTKAVDKTP